MLARNLDEIRDSGDLAWFAPAIDLVHTPPDELEPVLRDFFAPGVPLFVARAPGRLDVMGGIADYSGALVLQLPLARSTFAIAQAQLEPRMRVVSVRGGRPHAFELDLEPLQSGALRAPEAVAAWFSKHSADESADRWGAYVVGALFRCLTLGGVQPRGFRLLIGSEVPEGKGISSSAALEVATLSAVAASYGVATSPEELAADCQWGENHVAGAPCGIMDQMTAACGRRDRLLRLRCQPARVEGHVRVPKGYRFFGIDSGVRHAVTGADYETVRTAAFMGYRMIAEQAGLTALRDGDRVGVRDTRWRGYLANLTPSEFSGFEPSLPQRVLGADFLKRYGGITDTVTRVKPERWYPVRQAAAHPVREQARVERFADLLRELPPAADPRSTAAAEMGSLMYASNESYGACGLGSDGTDRLVALAAAAGAERGVFGAKITGGGSGGTVAVLALASAEQTVREISERYSRETGRPSEVFVGSGPGAAETGILTIE